MAELISMDVLRQEAQKRLLAQQAWADPCANHASSALLQELEIHKLELEVQNEELARAIAEAEAQRLKFQILNEISPCGHFTLSTAGEIFELNAAGAALLGAEAQDVIGRQLQVFIEPRLVPELEQLFAIASRTDREVPVENLTVIRPRRLPLYVSGQVKASAHLGGSRHLLASLVDVTTLKLIRDEVAGALERNSGFAPLR
jgi:PAS domain S-box-containing protein